MFQKTLYPCRKELISASQPSAHHQHNYDQMISVTTPLAAALTEQRNGRQ